MLGYRGWSKAVLSEMEADAYTTYPALVAANNVKDLRLKFYGHYSMCLYFECVAQPWSQACERAAVHADPGAFGYWPLINRPKGYYMQIVVTCARPFATPRLTTTISRHACLLILYMAGMRRCCRCGPRGSPASPRPPPRCQRAKFCIGVRVCVAT